MSKVRFISILWLSVLLMLVGGAASVLVGPTRIDVNEVAQALVAYDSSVDAQLAVREIRLPRAILATVVGASLAVAGALMQGVTRNPLASPSLMGLSGGATLMSLLAMIAWPALSYNGSIAVALAGAALGYGCAMAVATLSPAGLTPTRMALAGAVTSALFSAITQGLVIALGLSSTMLYWTVGGIANVTWSQVFAVSPCCALGLLGAWWLAPDITILSLGSEVAAGLGQRSQWVRVAATFAVLLLTGAAVAVAGPIAFVGLMVPHACRLVVGADYLRLLPLSIFTGASLMLFSDLLGRTVLGHRGEIPLGVVTAVLGAPFLIWLLRRKRQQQLDGGAPVQAVARRQRSPQWIMVILSAALLGLVVIALLSGQAELSLTTIARTLVGQGDHEATLVLWTFRIPRIVFAVFVGSGIAVSGALLQSVLRNDLAEPGILGVSAGASLAIVILFAWLGHAALRSVFVLPVAGVCGALAAMVLVYILCLDGQHSAPRLLLTGVALSGILGAVTLLLSLQISADAHAFVVAFGSGSLNAAGWNYVAMLGVVLAVLLPLAWSYAPTLNVLRLSANTATGLGVAVGPWSLALLTLAVAMCATCMAFAGGVLFLGLIAPHIARRLVGADHLAVVPASALLGAALLILADLTGRSVIHPTEIPAGVMVSALGAPYFLYLLTRP